MNFRAERQDALFINVDVDPEIARDAEAAAKLTELCPVDIYGQDPSGALRIVEENLDECVLCELCIKAAPPRTVRVIKLYDDQAVLRSG